MASGSAVEVKLQSHPKTRAISYQLGDEIQVVQLGRDGEVVRIAIADRVYEVSMIHSRAGELSFKVDGVTHTAFVASESSTQFVAVDGEVFELKKADPRRARRKPHHGEDNLSASMPGQVTKVLIGEGDIVQRGQPLIVLEAMKMEIKIAAPHDGRVVKVLVTQGQVVDRGQGLVEMGNDQ
jgi:3-methylcrotonyl-CoA carboxylase alpha subunit